MKKVLYSALAVTCAIAGVAASKVKANSHRTLVIYKYIGATPTTTALVTNLSNWTAVSSTAGCTSTQAACAFTSTIPTVTVSGRHIPSKPIDAAVGATVNFVTYYVPTIRTGNVYTYLHAFNKSI